VENTKVIGGTEGGAFMPLFREAVLGPCFSTGHTNETSHSPRVPTAAGGRDAGGIDHSHPKTRAKARA